MSDVDEKWNELLHAHERAQAALVVAACDAARAIWEQDDARERAVRAANMERVRKTEVSLALSKLLDYAVERAQRADVERRVREARS